jgi:hypothetical protein
MTEMTIMPFGSTAVPNSMANEMLIRLKWIKRDLNVSDELRVR